VHRYFFARDSAWFRDKLPYPLPPGETTKGSSDNLPLVLEGISKTDFERLLWVFYNPKYSIYNASIEEWTSILKLAHIWDFIEVKELAIRGLEALQIPALQKIALYQTYEVDRNLLQAAFTALTVRDEPIAVEEGREIGLETALQVTLARETARAPRRVGNPRSPVNIAGVDLDALINSVFSLSLASPGAADGHTTSTSQTSTSGGTATQTNPSPSSNATQGTGGSANGPTNGSTNGPPNGHVNGTTPNYSQNNTTQNNTGSARANGRGAR
jgi:hypothetical protein